MSMFDLTFVGAEAVIGDQLVRADLGVTGGVIQAVTGPGELADAPARESVDVSGAWLLPGGIDGHVHSDRAFCDDLATACRGAVRGGITTVGLYAYPNTDVDWSRAAAELDQHATGNHADVVIHWRMSQHHELAPQAEAATTAGIYSFKVFMDYPSRGLMWHDGDILAAMRQVAGHNGVMAVHAQCGDIVEALEAHSHLSGVDRFLACRPAVAEAEAIQRALALAKLAKCRIMIAHVSSADGLAAYRAANYASASIETCPQYLFLGPEALHAGGGMTKMGIPLRESHHRDPLIAAVADGTIDTVASDHAPYLPEEKDVPFEEAPNGTSGVETIYPLMIDRFGPVVAARVCASGPAQVFGLQRSKGQLTVGRDADVVVLDPSATHTVTAEALVSNARFSPYEGWQLRGQIAETRLRGRVVTGQPTGEHLRRRAFAPVQSRPPTVAGSKE